MRCPAPIDVTLRDPAEAERWAEALGAELLPTGSLRLRAPGQVSALPGYAEGAWWVQDAASALPARLLGSVRGKRVLDLCAAPGGKTLQLAAAGARVTALDISGERLRRLHANLARTRLAAEVVEADALAWAPAAPFEAILIDAPCSASGTIRRHPDLPLIRNGEELPPLVALQAALLRRAFGWLAPGGRAGLCHLLAPAGRGRGADRRVPQGGAGGAARAAAEPGQAGHPRGMAGLRAAICACARTIGRERGGMDGFFAALITKAAAEKVTA